MRFMHNNWAELFRPVISEELTLCAKLGLPHLVLTLGREDEPMPVKLGLAEDVDVVA
jgi:hypothetical protein